MRDRSHRLILTAYVGLGTAIAIQDVSRDWSTSTIASAHTPSATLLSVPLSISFFVLSGLRIAFDVPVELRANWLFRALPESNSDQAHRLVHKLILVFLAPVTLATTMIYSGIWGTWLGFDHGAFVLLASLLLAKGLFIGWRKIPFTCSYAAGKHNAATIPALYICLFFLFSFGLAHLEHWALAWSRARPWIVLIGLSAFIWPVLHYCTNQFTGEGQPLIFDDKPEPVVPSMGLL